MLKKFLALTAAASLAATPAVAATTGASALSVQPAAESDGGTTGNPFAAPGAGIGIALFGLVIVLGVLTATGTLFDDDDDAISV